MKRVFFLSVIMMILSGCTLSISDEFASDAGEIAVFQNGRSAPIGDTVLYDYSQDYGTHIKLEKNDFGKFIAFLKMGGL